MVILNGILTTGRLAPVLSIVGFAIGREIGYESPVKRDGFEFGDWYRPDIISRRYYRSIFPNGSVILDRLDSS